MKVIVKKPFADKFTKKMYNAGQELDFEDERAASLIERELVEAVATSQQDASEESEAPEGEPEKKAKRAPKKATKK